MRVARLHGPKDIRLAEEPPPPHPARGEVRLRVGAVGLCGSDLHLYDTGRIGYTDASSPFVLGHEFMGVVDALGDEALDGLHAPLQVGQRVAVDPAVPCWRCELCERGHPNLCPHHKFYGLYPEDGALRETMLVSARNCFPMPDGISDASGPLLETLGVAIHALDLAKLRIGQSVAVLGAGPVGLLIARLAVLAGADPVIVSDKFDWRLNKARDWGAAHTVNVDERNPVAAVAELTGGRGVDVAIEAAWADHSVQQAAEMARYGGRLALVGIPPDDKLRLQHSVARRKGLTIMMSRRMKHSYPRAIALAASGKVALDELVSHRFPLAQTAAAYASNAAYAPGINKVILQVGG
ncbi:MAG: alcohol dehydrogenase catalytic domain-containing protein [Chloroflexi bacterium]|nr:alcohol dehydrogenase catalytic domain-containing protein [Chloroflexota bacterium]MCY3581243.1 alcohol dehydrogenase catalytic domain-containing protein [Chloroflexota bacterium]MCY3714924.1 alcohol dehydrogenase catalytic domain-containing protein [Chloroflexota bacterium]MDE2651935.1 alcohol dehydrogenase catalytic domain-containing protein [Chloroflexota bacterium]MXV93809.1 alcohol dehydrogenase catalytic domain-containing protein [Chloroflexota bacterium]